MGGEKPGFVKIDSLLVVSGPDISVLNEDKVPDGERAEMVAAGANLDDAVVYKSADDRYHYSTFAQCRAPEMSVSERVARILLGEPAAMADEVTKQVLEVTGNHIRAAYIGKHGVTLDFDDEKELVVDVRAGLPAALIDGAEIYMEDGLLQPERDAQIAIQPVIKRLSDKFVPALGPELEAFPPEVDDKTYKPMDFRGADAYDAHVRDRQVYSKEVKRMGVRGVSVELEVDGESYVVGHVANGQGAPWCGPEDDLLRAAYSLLDEDVEIKTRIVGEDTRPFRAKSRATEMVLSDKVNMDDVLMKYDGGPDLTVILPDKKSDDVYLVEFCPKSLNSPMDIMERALYAEKNCQGVDVSKRLEEIGAGIGEPSTFMAKLLLDTLERNPENRIKTIYLDLVTYQ